MFRTSLAVAFFTFGPVAAATFDELVGKAVDRGVNFLKLRQAADGSFGTHRAGSTALATLALLECGTPSNDPAIQRAVSRVRSALPDLNDTYHLALAIMMLDRLGESSDAPLIHLMGIRLLEGQTTMGAWTYKTPTVSDEDQKKVRDLLERRELKTAPGAGNSPRTVDPDLLRRIDDLVRTAKDRDAQIRQANNRVSDNHDNSNTQFAILGLWGARRNGLPVDDALRRVDAYFRTTIDPATGSWGYQAGNNPRGKMAMTCAGLLGIAAHAGATRERLGKPPPTDKGGKPPAVRDPLKDPLVIAASAFVAAEMGLTVQGASGGVMDSERDYYALWSVERVGMVYSLHTIGPVAWYRVGATLILATQQPIGCWKASYEPEVDTSFALLFLKRSNLMPDLATALRAKPDPAKVDGKSTLKASADTPAAAKAAADPLAVLIRELQDGTPEQRTAAVALLRDAKGAENTDKLVALIPKLTGEAQKAVRDALAERLARMTADTLRTKLKDANGEVRRAAALACAIKEDTGLLGDLIAVLDDKDVWVVRAAGVALRQLTGQDFGPRADATNDDRVTAIAAWKEWWRMKRPK